MKDQSPLKRAWNIFSAFGGVIGTAGLIDSIASWGPFVSSIISGYEEAIRPIFLFFSNLVSAPSWVADYLFVGVMLSSARSRATYNMMNGHWLFDTSEYSWYDPFAPHKVAVTLVGLVLAVAWPLALLLFIRRGPYENKNTTDFQLAVWRAQWEWLGVYAIGLVSLLAINAGLGKLLVAL